MRETCKTLHIRINLIWRLVGAHHVGDWQAAAGNAVGREWGSRQSVLGIGSFRIRARTYLAGGDP